MIRNTESFAKAGMILSPVFSFRQTSSEDGEAHTAHNATPILSQHYGLHRELGITCEEAPKCDLSLSDMVGCSVDTSEAVPRLRIVSYPKGIEQSNKLCCGSVEEKRIKQVCYMEPSNLTAAQATVVANLWCSVLQRVLIMHKKFEVPAELSNLVASYNKGTILEVDEVPLAAKRHLLVFINPFSGVKKGLSIFHEVCKPVFSDAHLSYDVIVTERVNHCRDYIKDVEDLSDKCDGIVIVSGDGLMNEALQGVMERSDWAKCMQSISFGIIPAGTGNGLAMSESMMFGSEASCLRSAFVVAKGFSHTLDVVACELLHRPPKWEEGGNVERRYSFLSLEWALAADLDIGSDYLRWMGHARFTVEAVKRMLAGRFYQGRLSYLPQPTVPGYQGPAPKLCGDLNLEAPEEYWERHVEGSEHPVSRLPAIEEKVPEHWEVVEDDFKMLWSSNVEWIDPQSRLSPGVTMHDGLMQLLYMRKKGPGGAGRKAVTESLLALEDGSHVSHSAMETAPTTMYRLEPLSHFEKGLMAIDGEKVNYGTVQLEVLRGLGRFMVEGVVGHSDVS